MEENRTLLDAKDLMQQYGLSRVKTYQLLNDRTLPVIRLGRRLFVRKDDFETWLNTKQVNTGEQLAV